MEKRTRIVAAILVAVLIITGGLFAFRGKIFPKRSDEKTILANVESDKFNYPKSWSIVELTEADKSAGILFKLEHKTPNGNLIIRSIVGELDDQAAADKDKLATSVSDSLKAGIDGYTLLDKKVQKSGKLDVIRLTYDQKTDKKQYENIMAIIPTSKQIFYMTFRAEKSDFSKLEPDMNTLIDDFAIYVDTKIK